MSEQTKPNIARVVVQLVIVVLVAPLLPLIISEDWGWWQGWAYAAVNILSFIASRLIVARVHPDLIRERARGLDVKGTKPWDKVLAPSLALGTILIAITAGLDRLYGWSSAFPVWVNLGALIVIVLGYTFSSWALVVNRFFSGTVRIQTERGHHVVTDGPYRIVRHPGYGGGLLGFVLFPLLLDSAWSFIPAALLTVVVIIRTALEDRALHAELPGYAEYAQKTRYRLIPGVW